MQQATFLEHEAAGIDVDRFHSPSRRQQGVLVRALLTDPEAVALAAHHHDRLGPATGLNHAAELERRHGRNHPGRDRGGRAGPWGSPTGRSRPSRGRGEGGPGGCWNRGRSGGAGIAEGVNPPLSHRLGHLLGSGKGLETKARRRSRPFEPRPRRRRGGSNRDGGTTGSRPDAACGQQGETAKKKSPAHGNHTRAKRAGCPTVGPFPPDRGNGQGWPAVRVQQCHP